MGVNRRPAVQAGTRRRRPSGEPPPLPRHVGTSGYSWIVAAIAIVALSIGVFSEGWRGPAVAVTVADDTVVRWLSEEVAFSGYRPVMRSFAALGSLWLITVLLWALVAALLVLRRLRHLVVLLVAWNAAGLVYFAVAAAAQRPRPFGVRARGDWVGWALPSLPVAALALTVVAVLYTLVPEGRLRNVGKWLGAAGIALVAVGRIAQGVDAPTDVAVGAALGVTIPLVAFRLFTPGDVFPVTYRRGRSAHLDVGGKRGLAIRRALEEQLGLLVEGISPFGLAGSAGSTPLKIELRGGHSPLFGKLYANNHLRSDRWYKIGRELLYGRLEDEKPFHTVRRLVQQEDYALRLFRDSGLPTPTPYGVAELTPEREYLLVTEFFAGAVELGEVPVDEDLIDSGLRIVRQLWDAGLAHRDIKPSNLLVRDSRILLIDVAFAELRPTPWRQAIDLANMMLCLALQSSADQVYQRALRQFSVADIGEAFAAARGLALPSQLRHALRAQGRDLHGEFVRMLPAPPRPVAIQRWNLRRVGLWASVLAALLLVVGNRSMFTLTDEDSKDLQVHGLSCRAFPALWLTSQAVPSASLLPCVVTLPAGWQLTSVSADRSQARYSFSNDRAGDDSMLATLGTHCDVARATEVAASDNRVRRFQRVPSASSFNASWQDLFPGGCLSVRVLSKNDHPDVNAQVGGEAPLILGYISRPELGQALRDRSDGRLRLDPPPP